MVDLAREAGRLQTRAELLKAWLALTIGSAVSKPIRCQGIKRWLTLTMVRATGPIIMSHQEKTVKKG